MDNTCSWIICAMSFLAQALSFGVYNAYGTVFVAIIKEYNVGEEEAAWVGSISYSLALLGGIITSPMCRQFGCCKTACVGAILYGIGLLSSSFAPSLTVWYFTYGVIFSFGTSCTYLASVLILSQHFEKHYAVATGISGSGTGFGGLFLSKFLEVLIETYGLRISLRVIASFAVILFAVGITYGFRSYRRDLNISSLPKSQSPSKSKFIDLRVWRNGAFVIWTTSICIVYFVVYIPYVHLVRLAMDIEISASNASLLLGYVSAAQSVGKIIFGKLSDNQRVNRLYVAQVSLLIVSISHTLCPLSDNYMSLCGYTLVYGVFDGGFHAVVVVVCGDIVGKEHLHSALGSLFLLASLSIMFGPPLAGFIYSSTGSYDPAFFVCGGVVAFAACMTFLIPWFVPQNNNEFDNKLCPAKGGMEDINSNIGYNFKDKELTSISLDSGIEITSKEDSSFSSDSTSGNRTDKHSLILHMNDSSSSKIWTEIFDNNKEIKRTRKLQQSIMFYPYVGPGCQDEVLVVVDKVTMV